MWSKWKTTVTLSFCVPNQWNRLDTLEITQCRLIVWHNSKLISIFCLFRFTFEKKCCHCVRHGFLHFLPYLLDPSPRIWQEWHEFSQTKNMLEEKKRIEIKQNGFNDKKKDKQVATIWRTHILTCCHLHFSVMLLLLKFFFSHPHAHCTKWNIKSKYIIIDWICVVFA